MSAAGRQQPGGPERSAPALRQYLEVLLEHWWIVVACLVVVLAVAVVYVETAPRRYTAQAQMLVTPASPSDTALFSLPVLHSTGVPTSDVLTASSLVTTPAVATAAAAILKSNESASALLADVQVTPVGQSNLISVQATAPTGEQAARTANAFVTGVVATRAAALHAALAGIIPGLQAQVAALPPAQRNGPGSLGAQLAELVQLRTGNDPTITASSPAEVPTAPSSPKVKLTLVAGLIAGLVIGIGAAFAFQSLDPRLRREEQLRDIFDAPTLGRIPREHSGKMARPILPRGMSLSAKEGYRTLRTILASRRQGDSRSILITSSAPSEGKTTSAIALALSLAQTGARVILIEADLRRPTIASTLDLHPRYGTEDVLTGEADLDEAITVATFDDVPVGVLAVNELRATGADRLSPNVAQRIIDEASKLAEYVILDSPPLPAVIDALPLAQAVDEILVVARLNVSKLKRLASLRDLLVEQGIYPTGVLLIADAKPDLGYYSTPVQSSRPRASQPRGVRLEEPRTTL